MIFELKSVQLKSPWKGPPYILTSPLAFASGHVGKSQIQRELCFGLTRSWSEMSPEGNLLPNPSTIRLFYCTPRKRRRGKERKLVKPDMLSAQPSRTLWLSPSQEPYRGQRLEKRWPVQAGGQLAQVAPGAGRCPREQLGRLCNHHPDPAAFAG